MKRFLSVLLAVMMVLSSTVSYAAPSLADFVDSVIEAPEFEDELFEETPVEDDSATLSEESVTLNDVIEFDFETDTTPFTASVDDANTDADESLVGASTSQFRGAALTQVTEDGVGALKININEGGNNTKFNTEKYGDVNSGMNFVINARPGQLKKFEIRFKSDKHALSLYGNNGTANILPEGATSGNPVNCSPAIVADGETGWYIGTRTNFDGWSHSNVAKCQFGFNGTFAVNEVAFVDYVRFELYNPEVTIVNDVEGIIDDFSEKIQGGTYTIDELETMLDPDGKMDSKGYYLAGLRDEEGAGYAEEVTFTEDATYTAVWDMIKVLKSWEFTNGAESGATPNYVNTVDYDDGLLYMFKPTGTQPRIALSFDRIEVSDISDIVTKVKFVGTGFNNTSKSMSSVFVSGWNSNGYEHGEAEKTTDANGTYGGQMGGATFVATDNVWTIGKFSEDFTDGKVAADTVALKGIRFNFTGILTNGAEQGVYVDYIRILGKDAYSADNALIDMSLAPVDVPNFKIFIEDTTKVADVLAAADAALVEAGYAGQMKAKSVYRDGAELGADAQISHHDELKILFASKKILKSHEFTSGTEGFGSQSNRTTVSYAPGYGEDGALKIHNLTSAEGGTSNDIFLALTVGYAPADISDIEVRVMYEGTDYNNQQITFNSVHMAGTKLDGTTFGFATSGYVPEGSYNVTEGEWTTFTYKTAISNFQTLLDTLQLLSEVRVPFDGSDIPEGADLYIDYIRIYGNDLATTYTLDIDGKIVEVDGEGMSTVADLLEAVESDKVPHALRIKGTDTLLFAVDALSGLYEAETLEVIFTEKKPLAGSYEFTTEAEKLSVYRAISSISEEGTLVLERSIDNEIYHELTPNCSISNISDVKMRVRYNGTDHNEASLSIPAYYHIGGNYTLSSYVFTATDGEWVEISLRNNFGAASTIFGDPTNTLVALRTPQLNNAHLGYSTEGNTVTFEYDYIRILGNDNYPYVAILDGTVAGQPVTVTVPYDDNTTVATAIDMMNLNCEAGYVSAIASSSDGTAKLVSILGAETGIHEFSYVDKIPVTIIVDGEKHAARFEAGDTVAEFFEAAVEIPFGKAAHALRYAGTEEFLFLEDTLTASDKNAEFQVIFTERVVLNSYEFTNGITGTGLTLVDGNRATSSHEPNLSDGALKIYNLTAAELTALGKTNNNDIYMELSFDYTPEQLFDIEVKVMYDGSFYNEKAVTFNAVHMAGEKKDGTTFGFGTTGYIPSGSYAVTEDKWTTFTYKTAIPNFATLLDGLNRFTSVRLPFSDGSFTDGTYIYVDYIRFLGNELKPNVAVFDGFVGGEPVTVTVPYDETTTVATAIAEMGLDNEAGYVSAIGDGVAEDTTIASLLNNKTGVLTFDYVDKTPVTLVVDEVEHTAYIETTDTASVLFANSAVEVTGKAAGALRVVGEKKVLSPDDSLAEITAGTKLQVIWSENDDFGFDFHAGTGGTASAGTGNATLSDFKFDDVSGYTYKRLTNDTATSNQFRLEISNLQIPPEKLTDIYMTIRSSLDKPYHYPSYAGSYGNTSGQNSTGAAGDWLFPTEEVIGENTTAGNWYTLHYSIPTTNYMYTAGVGYIRYDFKNDLTVANDWVDIADIRFVSVDVAPVLVVEGTKNDTPYTFEIVINASTTVAEVISKLGLNDANGVVSALRTADGTEYTSGLISDIFGGTDCGYLEFVYETTQAITVEKNVAYTDVTDALVTATGSGSYSPRQTVADILANITVSPEYAGVYVVAGLATSAKGAPLAATTKVSELASNTLYIVWGELNIIAGTEFSSAEDVMGDTECTEVVENGVLKLTRTANGEIYLGFSDVLNVAEVDDIQIRLRYVGNGKTDTTTSDYWFVEWDGNFVNNGITYPVNDGQWVTLSFKKNIGGSIADVKNASSKITSFRTPHFDEDVMPVGTSIEIDFVRVIGTEPLNYVTVDVSALTGIENDTLRYGFNKTKTFDQIRERLEKDLEDVLDENTAITGLIYNDTTYTGSTTLYSVVGQTDCEMTVDYGKAKTVTLVQESLTSPDGETVVSNIAASAYPASTTLGELKALLSLDSADFFVEGFTNAIYGAAYPNDTQLSYFGKDVTNVELYVAYDKQVILDGSEFTEKPVGNQTAFASDEIIDDPAATDGKAYKITMNSGSLYSEFQRRSIDVSEVSDIVARVKATVVKKAYFPFVYSVSGTQSTPGSEQYTFSTDYDVVRLSTYATLPAEGILTSFRPPMAHSNVDSFPVGGSIIYDYIRVLGKPLPEVNVADIDSQYGDIELSGYDLMNVDYLKSMTFADLVEKIGYTPVDAYRIVAFVGEREYGLHENMTEALGGTGTVNLTPVVEKVFGKTYRVDFGTQADFFAEIGTAVELDVTEYGKTLADLAAKMVDHGNKIFKGFATSADATEVLALDTPIAPSSEEEYVANNNTAPVAIYYAIWEDYIVNDLYSVEFVENKGYKVSTPGKASKYAMDALEENGTDYVWGDENNELPEVFEYQFVEHKTDESNGYIRLKFDASPYAVAQIGKPITNKAGQVITPTHAGTWDSSIVLGGLSGSPYIPAGLIDKVIIRMRYGGVLPTEKTYFATPGSGEGYSTVSPTDFYAPFFYYTNEDYINFTDSQRYINYIDVSKDIYNGKWFTVVVDAADLKLDSKDLYDLRIDPTNGMLDGSYLDIDFIRFTQKTAGVVNEEAVKSQKDFEEGSELYNTLATNVRAAVNNDGLNGVRVMGWLYVYADASAHTKNAGWMFSASDRFKRAVADSEDGWMNKLTMDLYNDAKFNTSSLILVGNYIEDGEKVTTPQGYDSENPLFSAVLYNIPVKNYESNFVVRPYVEYAGRFIYGEPFEMNFYDFAFGTDYTGDIAGAGGAYGACENKDCAICNYLEECYVNWNAHVAEKATFTEHYNNNFASIMVPSTITSYIVIPTGTISNETDTQVDLEVWQNGSIATVTVNKANTWPALVVDGKLNSLYTLRPCAYNNGYILSLGYGRDSDNGNHVGIEKTDTSVLNGEAVADANEMFIRNRFVPEAQSPFRQINRLAQLPMTGANASNSTFVNSFFLGDHGFGYYWFSTTIWSGTTREYWAGKTAYPLENAKVVVKYNYSDGTSEWVTYDKTALYNLTTIDFSNISYIVSNDIDNKPVDNETVSGSANGISYSGVECPFEVEDLVFLFGEVDVPAASADSIEFNTASSNYSDRIGLSSGRYYSCDEYYLYSVTSASNVANGIANLTSQSANQMYVKTPDAGISLDAALYNTIRIRVNHSAGSSSAFTLSYTKLDGGTGSVGFDLGTYGGVDTEGYRIIDIDLSEVYSWNGTVTEVKLTQDVKAASNTYNIDYIRFLATGYDSNAELERIGGVFEGFEKGFKINGFEGSSDDAFKPTVEFFETVDGLQEQYDAFVPGGDANDPDDQNFADWTVDPLYTFDYYGVYNNIIKNSANYSETVAGNDATWNFSSLYNSKYRDLRWSTMVNGGDAFTQYYSNYEFQNGTVTEDGVTYNRIYDVAGSKELIYKPDYTYTVNGQQKTGDVLTMTLNSSALYNGSAQKQWSSVLTTEEQAWHFWPHLLIQQSRGSQPVKIVTENGKLVAENKKYRADADRIFAEFDIRLQNFEKIGSESINMSFLLYAYLCPNVNPAAKIWFGIPLADDSGADTGGMSWGRESGANTHMCNLSQAMVYGSTEGSVSAIIQDILNGTDKATYNLGDWIHVKLDLTPYIDMAIEMANAEDAFGLGVTSREDWHFNGVNVGYECSGNVDATFEFANFNFYSYNDTTND